MGGDQIGIDPAQADGLHPVSAQGGQEVDVDLPGVHQLGNLEGPVVGDAPSCHHAGLAAEPSAQGGGLGTAPVYHHDPDAERRKQGQLSRDAVENLGLGQDLPAELHHEDLVAVGAHVAERALESGYALRCIDRQCRLPKMRGAK